ncbi:MAG: 30S ribosomal protein S9 [Armatimonadota bacterium]
MEVTRYYATGHRKNATAKVWLMPGTGNITVNDRPLDEYVKRKTLEMIVKQPLEVVGLADKYDVMARVLGGGISGQAGAIRHGIAKALLAVNPELRPTLKRMGFLTRDPRVKERKKYGRKRARRGFQYCKR